MALCCLAEKREGAEDEEVKVAAPQEEEFVELKRKRAKSPKTVKSTKLLWPKSRRSRPQRGTKSTSRPMVVEGTDQVRKKTCPMSP